MADQANYTTQICESYQMPNLNCLSCSSDINLIENVWHMLKDMLNKQHSHPANMQQISKAIVQEWYQIPETDILALVDSMPERIEAVVAAGGGHTRW